MSTTKNAYKTTTPPTTTEGSLLVMPRAVRDVPNANPHNNTLQMAGYWDSQIHDREAAINILRKSSGLKNGQLPPQVLSHVGSNEKKKEDFYLLLPAAGAYKALAEAFYKEFHRYPKLRSAYRSLEEQNALIAEKEKRLKQGARHLPQLAAAGESNHGLGLAVDFAHVYKQDFDDLKWIKKNAAKFGFVESPFTPREKWHYEYLGGINLPALKMVTSGTLHPSKNHTG